MAFPTIRLTPAQQAALYYARKRRRARRMAVEDEIIVAPPYEEPTEDPIDAPSGEPVPPSDTPTDPETDEPEPGIDPDFTAADRIEVVDAGQGVQRTQTDPGTWGNSYVAALLTGPEYWEVLIQNSTPVGATMAFGVSTLAMPLNGIPGALAGTIAYWSNGEVRQDGAVIATLSSYGRGDRIGISYGTDGSVRFFKNCAPLNGGEPVGTVAGSVYPFAALYSANARMGYRFSLSRFGCAVPSGFHPIGQVPVQIFVEDFEGEQQYFESGYALKHVQTSNGRRAMSWDVVPDAADVEVLARIVLADAANERFGIAVRGAGSGGSETAYVWQVDEPVSEGDENLIKYVSGSSTQVHQDGDAGASSRRYWLRFRVNGTSLQGKTWRNGDEEPTDWSFDGTDSSISGAGWVGLFSFDNEGASKYCEYFAVGINGASAPAMGTTPGVDQYATDFSEADANDDWSNQWNATGVTRSVVTTADDILPLIWYVNGIVQRDAGYSGDENENYVFFATGPFGTEINAGSQAFILGRDFRNFDAVFLCEATSKSFGSIQGLFRAGKHGGYGFGFDLWDGSTSSSSDGARIRKYDASGSNDTLAADPGSPIEGRYSYDVGEDHYFRVRCEGTNIKAKAWKATDPEPTDWRFDITDDDADFASGSVGMAVRRRTAAGRLKYVAVSSDPNTPAPLPE